MMFVRICIVLAVTSLAVNAKDNALETPEDRLYDLLQKQLYQALRFRRPDSLHRTLNRFTQYEDGNYKMVGRSILCERKDTEPRYVSKERWEEMAQVLTDDIHESLTNVREIYEMPYEDDEQPYLFQMPTWKGMIIEAKKRYWSDEEEDEDYIQALSNFGKSLNTPKKVAQKAKHVMQQTVDKVKVTEIFDYIDNLSTSTLIFAGVLIATLCNLGIMQTLRGGWSIIEHIYAAIQVINLRIDEEYRITVGQAYVCGFASLLTYYLSSAMWMIPVALVTSWAMHNLIKIIRKSAAAIEKSQEDLIIAIPGLVAVMYVLYRVMNHPVEGWLDKINFWSTREASIVSHLLYIVPAVLLPAIAYLKVIAAQRADTTTKTMVERYVLYLASLNAPDWINTALQPESILSYVAAWRSACMNPLVTGIISSIPITIISIAKGLITWKEPSAAQAKAMMGAWIPEYAKQVVERHKAHKMIAILIPIGLVLNMYILATLQGSREIGWVAVAATIGGLYQMDETTSLNAYVASSIVQLLSMCGYDTIFSWITGLVALACMFPIAWHKMGLGIKIDTRDHETTKNVVQDIVRAARDRLFCEEIGVPEPIPLKIGDEGAGDGGEDSAT